MNIETQPWNLVTKVTKDLDYFLVEISGEIQITKTMFEKAEGHYQAVSNFLKESPKGTLLHALDVKIHPFGGFGSNTAVYPLKKDEHDLDLNVQMMTTIQTFGDPKNLKLEVFNRLASNGLYKNDLEIKDRCIRLHYAGQFHLDLQPSVCAFPLPNDSTKIHIAERQKNGLYTLVTADPIGLLNWFEKKCALEKPHRIQNFDERASFVEMPLPSEESKKPVLKQANQLLKRARDIYFADDDDCKKILKSILILTVSGDSYTGETSLYHVVARAIASIEKETASLAFSSVRNPVNQSEDFMDSLRKKPERYAKLRSFVQYFKSRWMDLASPHYGLKERSAILEKLFGESPTQTVMNNYGIRMDEAKRKGLIRMASAGTLGFSASSGTKIPRQQMFGDKV